MTKEEIKQQLQSVFEADYPGIDIFIEKVICLLFVDDEYIALPARKDILADKDAAILEGSNIESVYLYGEVDTFVPIKVYDITIKDNANIGISRVGIQKFVRQHIAPDSQAFMLFHYRNAEGRSWRFSYLYKEFTQAESTNAKRYTYLFGRDHRARTAVERFSTLAGKAMNDAQPLLDAFSVQKLSDDFFDEYNEHYLDFVQYITGKRNLQVGNNKWEDVSVCEPDEDFYGGFNHDDKRVRDYVKKMMGRLVFLCFIQRKGWMGNRDMQYMQNLYRNSSDEVKADFLDSVLEPMFFGLLNTKPEDRADKFRSEGWDISLITDAGNIPYLNGGLFEQDSDDAEKSVFPCQLFSNPDAQEVEKKYSDNDNYDYSRKRGVLDFFAAYNFTIDENDPDDAEVGVDPEMLSRIFENLLEDNKDKGAFYTPKEIVQYMCRESLIAYLQTDETDEVVKDNIRQFVLTHNSEIIGGADSTLAVKILKALKEVKVCDPAIGSGAFPMGLLNELVHCREVLEKGKIGRGEMKREIIQENIYGVDIEKGAVDIARLRFWLSIVVDEETPHALPNMDFKIMQGNSLLEQYEGVDLSGMSLNEQKKRKTRKGEVYQPSFAFDEQIALENIQKAIKQYYQTESHEAKVTLRKTIDGNVKSYILNLKGCTPEIQSKLDKLQIPNNQFFLWHIYFKEVFDKGGFDIVIGNPPYISTATQVANPILLNQRDRIIASRNYATLHSKWDLYVPFMERGIQLLCHSGIMSMIVPYPLTNQIYAKKLRELIVSEYTLFELVDLNGTKIFDNATVSSCIPFVRKKHNNVVASTVISHIIDNKSIKKDFSKCADEFVPDNKSQIWYLEENTKDVNKHSMMNVLGDYCYVSKGMVLYSEEGLFTNKDLVSDFPDTIHCRKYIEAKDIERYEIQRTRYLEYNTDRVPNKVSRPTFRELYEAPKLITNCLGELKVTVDMDEKYICQQGLRLAVLWKDIKGVNNKSITSSIKKYSSLTRHEMELLSENINLRYILGIMASKYGRELLNLQRAGDYHIVPEHIRNIPIAPANKEQQEKIIILVDRILAAKKANLLADTTADEREIDRLVYDLYGLTEDEINMVEKG